MEELISKAIWYPQLDEMVCRAIKALDLALLTDHRPDLFQHIAQWVSDFKDFQDIPLAALQTKNEEWTALITECLNFQNEWRNRQQALALGVLQALPGPKPPESNPMLKTVCFPTLSPSGFIVPKELINKKETKNELPK